MNLNITYPAFEPTSESVGLIAMALDRDRLVHALKGIPTPSTGGLFTSISPYYQEGLAIPYDPEGAKALLAEAGAEGSRSSTSVRTSPDSPRWPRPRRPTWRRSDECDAEIATPEVWIDKSLQRKEPAADYTHLWDPAVPTRVVLHGRRLHPGSDRRRLLQPLDVLEPEFDELTTQAHVEQDPEEIVELYMEMDKNPGSGRRRRPCRCSKRHGRSSHGTRNPGLRGAEPSRQPTSSATTGSTRRPDTCSGVRASR